MSYFLIYFERNDPEAGWDHFQKKGEPVIETFNKVNDPGSFLNIEPVNIFFDNRTMHAYLIHDGVSSDKILDPVFKNDPVVSKQKKVVLDFLENRITANRAVNHYFILHLYQQSIDEEAVIDDYDEKEIRLPDITEFSNAIGRNVLYKLME